MAIDLFMTLQLVSSLNFIFAGYDRIPSLVMVSNMPCYAYTTQVLLINLCINTYLGQFLLCSWEWCCHQQRRAVSPCVHMHVSVHICTVFYRVYVHVCIRVYAFVRLYVEDRGLHFQTSYLPPSQPFFLRQDLSLNPELSDLDALASKSQESSTFLLLPSFC